MPQGPTSTNIAENPSDVRVPLVTDGSGALVTTGGRAELATLNITLSTEVVVGGGRLGTVIVNVAGKRGAIYDSASIAAVTAANLITHVGSGATLFAPTNYDFPFKNGLTVVPGSGSTLAVAYTEAP